MFEYKDLFSQETLTMKSSLIRELVASTRNIPGLISFAGGFPSPRTFPKQELAELYAKVLSEEGAEVLQYGSSEGDNLLKEQLLKWEGYPQLSFDNLLITVGSTNAIFYYAKSMLNSDDVVLCEAPSFLGSIIAFDALGAEVKSVEMDEEGLNLECLDKVLKAATSSGKKVKFLYTIPDFNNPCGLSMSHQRRKELIEYCRLNNLPILEDNPYSRLRYMGESIPTLYRVAADEYDDYGIVTEVVSFSKILGPGMRLAFAKGSPDLIEKMCSWQQKVNITPDCITERVAARFIEKGLMEPHIQNICTFYKPYLETMLNSLAEEMPGWVNWTRPEGGMFLWVWLPEKYNADELFEKAKEHKVSFIPGSKFYPEGEEQYNCFRLNFSYASMQQIKEGIQRLAELLKAIST